MKVALIGKTNVGKSTLFNRIVEEKRAIVSDEPHTTRDRIHQKCSWRNQCFTLIDVGGITLEKPNERELEKEINNQIEMALKEANLIIFLVEASGLTYEDRLITQKIKKIKKPIILTVNKTDRIKKKFFIQENFSKLGLGLPVFISAISGIGVGDLLDRVCEKLKEINAHEITGEIEEKKEEIKVGLFGKTNVGKSTLVNALLNEKRIIVSPLRHTTREPIDVSFYYQNQKIIFVDTAGIRKRNKIKSTIEKNGILKSLDVLENVDIILLITDISQQTSAIEKQLITRIKKNKKPVLVVINKIDLIDGSLKNYHLHYQKEFKSLWQAPIIFISAKKNINLSKLLNHLILINKRRQKIYNQDRLQFIINQTIKKYNFKQRYWANAEIKQQEGKIPIFKIKLPRITNKEIMPRQAQFNILEKEIRQHFDLWGIPINLINVY